MTKNIIIFISLCLAISPIYSIKHSKTAYEIGNESIDRLYCLCVGALFGGLSYELGRYAYKGYNAPHQNNDTYINKAIDIIVQAKDTLFGATQEEIHNTGMEAKINIDQLLIIPAALLSLSCGFYALTAFNKALFYARHLEQKQMQHSAHIQPDQR